MANLVSDGHLVVPEVLDREVGLLLGDRVFLGNHPVLETGFLGVASGSTKVSKDFGSHGLNALTSVAEATTMGGPTPFDFKRVSVTVARQVLQRRVSQVLQNVETTGAMSEERLLAVDAVGAYSRRMTELIATIGSTFTGSVDAGGQLEWAHLVAAQARLRANGAKIGVGRVMAVLSNEQWFELQLQLVEVGLSDAMTHAPEAYQAVLAEEMGYMGRFYGIDVFTTESVPVDTVEEKFLGCMLAPYSIGWAKANIAPKGEPREYILQDGLMQVRFKDNPDTFVDDAYYNALFGVSKGLDGAGCVIKSAA